MDPSASRVSPPAARAKGSPVLTPSTSTVHGTLPTGVEGIVPPHSTGAAEKFMEHRALLRTRCCQRHHRRHGKTVDKAFPAVHPFVLMSSFTAVPPTFISADALGSLEAEDGDTESRRRARARDPGDTTERRHRRNRPGA